MPITKPTYSQKKPESFQEVLQRRAIESDKQKAADWANDLLNPDKYPEHPELQQEIRDHLTLKDLRAKYFHTSHECSTLKAVIGIAYFDPYQASIRTKPSRKIVNS